MDVQEYVSVTALPSVSMHCTGLVGVARARNFGLEVSGGFVVELDMGHLVRGRRIWAIWIPRGRVLCQFNEFRGHPSEYGVDLFA